MQASRAKGARWALACASPVVLVAALAGGVATGVDMNIDVENAYPSLVFATVLPFIGVLILNQLPKHPLGRLFLACGLASTVTVASFIYGSIGLVDRPGSLPAAVAVSWLSSWVWALGFMPLTTLGVLLFPDGHLPGPRWRPVLWCSVAGPVLTVLGIAFTPGPLDNHPVRDNPFGLPLPEAVFSVLTGAGFAVFLVGFVGAAVATVLRWRRARGVERAQLTWFAIAAVVLVVTVILPVPGPLGLVLKVVGVPFLPLAVAVAILRRHLFGIEVAVRRSLVYGALTAVLLAVYSATVLLLGRVLEESADPAVAVVATALVAVGFAPVRERLQASANRLLYGDRDDPYRVLTATADADELDEIARTVATSLRLPYVRVELPGTDITEPMAGAWGEPVEGTHDVELRFRGISLGTLSAAPRGPHDPFRSADLRLLDDLGRQIGVAAHAMLLSRDLQRSREHLVTMREEERRRIRRDLHDGLGPALAGVALGLDAVGRLVDLQPEEASRLSHQLKNEVHASLADVRRLVEDLRPPALDQLGLVGAIRQQAAKLAERDTGLEVAVDAVALPALPAAVEVAAYRITTEALNNVHRHAAARHCGIRFAIDGDRMLLVEIEDDGIGISGPRPGGVGLPAMRERAVELGGRCDATAVPSGGTRVAARIPLVAP